MTPLEIAHVQTPVLKPALARPVYRFLRQRVTVGREGTCPICSSPPTALFLSPYDAPDVSRCMECVLYAFLTNAVTHEEKWLLENSVYCIVLTDEDREAMERDAREYDDWNGEHPEMA